MNKVVCLPNQQMPEQLRAGVVYYSMYTHSDRAGQIGSIASRLLNDLEFMGVLPSPIAWDFATFALAVGAADLAVQRANSVDGWTRAIELDVALVNPQPFADRRQEIAEMLRYLSGDFWTINFLDGGRPAPQSTAPTNFDADCVSLLSGGMDSLVGGIDLTALGRKPLFVSQLVKGNREDQHHLARQLGGADRHLLWNSNVVSTVEHELSTRARSIIFYGFAAMAASALPAIDPLYIFVPENGFISLNVALNPGRIGSLSTKTTHPVFLKKLQGLWDGLGLRAKLHTPYKFQTKGQVLARCEDPGKLLQLLPRTTSCGKYGRLNEHCGRCVPCLVRRASFLAANIQDPTPTYRHPNLQLAAPSGNANDINAVAIAYLRYRIEGVAPFTAGALSFADAADRTQYEAVVGAGIAELGKFLEHEGVI